MLKLAFYTCFYGGSENPAYRVPVAPSERYPCFYITNNSDMVQKLAGTRWVPVFDDTPTADNVIESNMVAKRVKTTPHTFPVLRDFDYLCFLDSKLEHVFRDDVEKIVRSLNELMSFLGVRFGPRIPCLEFFRCVRFDLQMPCL